MTQIKKFAILGERCSGTNFLEESITNNFNIEYTAEYGNKHFFCYNNYDMNSTKETLFIGIVRNPIYWINSFSKELYHIPEINKNINNFLFNEFYSVEEKFKNTDYLSTNIFVMNNNLNSTPKLNHKDLNYTNGKKYTNIFELRKVKNNFLMNVMPNKVQNFILINYEDLLFNYTQTLQLIKDKFGLQQKIPEFIRIKKYKKSDTYNFVKQREITLPVNIIQIIWNNLNVEQEKRLGYIPGDNNNFFKNRYINI
jgi:nicotinamide riboside kinase